MTSRRRMPNLGFGFCKHGTIRFRQRGFRLGDEEMFYRYGTDIGIDRLVMLKSDIEKAIKSGENPQQFDRLKKKELVVDGRNILTGYVRHKARKGRVRRRTCEERGRRTCRGRRGSGPRKIR